MKTTLSINERTALLTSLTEREGDGFVSHCPELDIASQGDTAEESEANLHEAVELFLECADAREIQETFYLKSIPGVWESIEDGKKAAREECFSIKEVGWTIK